MKSALFIIGPTAVGKTSLAFKISKKLPSVLISADSVQVFKGADIISGKEKHVKTYLLDVVSCDQKFSVKDFIDRVRSVVQKSFLKNKIPIIVGGTGFYLDALFGTIETIDVPPNEKLRKKLNEFSVEELQIKLKKENPGRFARMNNSDVNNKRRLIRAIEIGNKVSKIESVLSERDVLIIGLRAKMGDLRKKIEKRVSERIRKGALDEAKKLFSNYENLSSQIKTANGYRELFDYLSGKISFDEARERWVNADYKHAKNQMTWFRRNKNIHWFDIEKEGFEKEAIKLILATFKSSNIRMFNKFARRA
jgi:tRNA dimethylallyltransferase